MTSQGHPLEILSVGEAIIDFLPGRRGRLRDVDHFHKIVGGAPANVALGLAHMGRRVGLMGRIGDDEFGAFLRQELEAAGVDTAALMATAEAPTGFTFVSLSEDGERSFTSPMTTTADQTLRPEELDLGPLERAQIVHLGSNQMVTPVQLEATTRVMRRARQLERFITFDPNVRLHLWEDPARARPTVLEAMSHVDLVKLNDEEIAYLGQGVSAQALYDELLAPAGVIALVATRGDGGAEVFCGPLHARVGAPDVEVVDTTGAGDGFVAGLLAGLCARTDHTEPRGRHALAEILTGWDQARWRGLLALGCLAGSHVCQTLGATTNLLTHDQISWGDYL